MNAGHRFFLYLAFSFQMGASSSFAATLETCRAFDQNHRLNYIKETSEQISPWQLRIGKALDYALLPLGFGTPLWLRGIKTPVAAWEREGHLSLGRPRAMGDFDSWFGRGTIFTQSGEVDSVTVLFKPAVGDRSMTTAQKAILRRLFPALTFRQTGRSLFDLDGPSVLQLQLLREHHDVEEPFADTARSFLNTLFNDPRGELGLQLGPRFIPEEVLNLATSKDDETFLRSFGRWSPILGGITFATKKPFGEQMLGTGLSINVRDARMVFTLQTTEVYPQTLANLRRILRAALHSGLVTDLDGRLPTTSIYGRSLVYVTELPVSKASLDFARKLDSYQNSPVFDIPLVGLLDFEKDLVREWLDETGLDQGEYLPAKVTFDDLVVSE